MRLTLRTLLSWKDGMLDPEAGRDLAARVEASADARSLVERIDEVVARPTLSAPAPDAAGFATAANTTAEYLDNVLPAERLGEFERVCFASEAQLAETAATHEMLAELSRAPAEPLDRAAGRRLLAAARRVRAGTHARRLEFTQLFGKLCLDLFRDERILEERHALVGLDLQRGRRLVRHGCGPCGRRRRGHLPA